MLHNLASLKLSPTARWAQNATTVAGTANGENGSSIDMLSGPFGIYIADDDKSVEYYDSFTEDLPESLMKDIKKIVNKVNPDLFKIQNK